MDLYKLEEARNRIGRKVYFEDNPSDCLSKASKDNNCDYDILQKIEARDSYPFIKESSGSHWACIISYKEESVLEE